MGGKEELMGRIWKEQEVFSEMRFRWLLKRDFWSGGALKNLFIIFCVLFYNLDMMYELILDIEISYLMMIL